VRKTPIKVQSTKEDTLMKFTGLFWIVVLGVSVVAGDGVGVSEKMRKALSAEGRPAEDKARDAGRKPAEVLSFMGIGEGARVAELMCGRGWYVEVLSRVVGPSGRVFAHNSPFVLRRFAEAPLSRRLKNPDLANVTRVDAPLDEMTLPGELDAVLIVLFYHDTYWQDVDRARMNAAVFQALKPGGVYGVIDHRAEPGSGARDVQTLHRVDEALVKQEIIAAGFVLDGESDLLANPADTRDYNVFRDVRTDRDNTDRFVLRFRKPEK
jgi:predicted methyltransferase